MAGLWTDGGNGLGNEWESPSVDRVLEVLQAAPRRDVLTFLVDEPNRAVHTDELVDHIVAVRGLSDDPEQRRRVEIQLFHYHLPKLADEGVIEFDPRSDVLRYTPDDAIERWLNRICEWTDDTNADT